nr:hypothetical protein [Ktedonosporobacter rubrisoli]
MPVHEGQDGMLVEPNQVYVIPRGALAPLLLSRL